MLETKKHLRSVLQHCLGGGGGEGVITIEKDVFIPVQNSFLCSKALLFLTGLNTFVHDCSSSKRKNAQNAVTNKAAIRRLDRLADGEAYFEQIKEIISGVTGSFLTTGLAEIRAPASRMFLTRGS